MTDVTLAAISVEVDRLRDRLREGKVDRAAVIVLVDDKCYLALKARSQDDARDYLSAALLKAFVEGGLATQEEIDAM